MPIPLYTRAFKDLRRQIISDEDTFKKKVSLSDGKRQRASIVLSGEWYHENQHFVQSVLGQYKDIWTICEIWRLTTELGIVAVVALKPNRTPSRKVNKRVVNRAKSRNKITCIYTNRDLAPKDASAEHIIPLFSGGNNSVWNLCVADKTLNNDRGHADFWDFWHMCLRTEMS